jgi:hypothetical protein
MDNYTDEQLNKLIESHKKILENRKKYYQKVKDKDDFKIKNRARSNEWYKNDDNKNKVKQRYEDNKPYLKAKSSYKYYKKNDRLEYFKEKFPERWELIKDDSL